MTTDLEPGATSASGERHQPSRGPAMRAYCATLSRFTSAVQSTEQLLRNDEAGTREDSEQREVASAARLRSIERAGAAAEAGLEHTAVVRAEQGLPPPTTDDTGGSASEPHLLRRAADSDVGVALTSLGRRRDAVRAAETEFAQWLTQRDEQSRRIVVTVTAVVAVVAAGVMAVVGTTASAATSLALLAACTVAVVATALMTAAARRLPRVCAGAGLARRPHPVAMARYGGELTVATAVALAAVNVTAGAL
ncbi:hypothetical protein [Jiangella asiatica]|uniref:Uncharacterized protein n=1 Tax=Jiangella asiatica TaxID=2530372 RepID=A0A4R5DKQ9_9ACTN|nr:hypothetical protein [Jiangella asiatica]TDE12574.1 hypothetical protein E1269_06955 [Jiangella asiatica]